MKIVIFLLNTQKTWTCPWVLVGVNTQKVKRSVPPTLVCVGVGWGGGLLNLLQCCFYFMFWFFGGKV